MPNERSIANPSVIPVTLLLLFVATCETQPSFRRLEPRDVDAALEDTIASGIRHLEHIRREIVESSVDQQRDRRGVPSMHGESSGDSGHSTRLAGAAGSDEKGSSVAGPAEEVRYPRRQVDSAMYRALAKLANVQIARPGIRGASWSVGPQDVNVGSSSLQKKSREAVDEEGTGKGHASSALPAAKPSPTESNKLRFIPRKFHCHPIREIYVPKVEKKMPAYACSLGKRAFVISSERFVEDGGARFDVNVDESTFRRLTPLTSGVAALTSGVSVLPATLVLKQGEDGYTVRGVNASWKDVRATGTGDN